MSSPSIDRRLGLTGNKAYKAPCDVATTANITLSGEQTIDGVTTSSSRVLVWNQSNTVDNGIWDSSTGSWSRAVDCNTNQDLAKGTQVLVTGGTSYSGQIFEFTSANPIIPGTSAITIVRGISSSTLEARLASTASAADGAGMVAVASDKDYAYGTVGDRFEEFVSITEPRFGYAGGDATAAMTAANAYAASRDVSGDAAGPGGGVCVVIPRGAFAITSDVPMHRNVISYGKVTGAFNLKFTNLKKAYVIGLFCEKILIDGMWFSTFVNCQAPLITIKGGGVGFGTFWNSFTNLIGNVVIDLSNWSVDQNLFNGRGGFTTTGTSGSLLDGHANNTSMWDFTGGQCANTSTIQQDSLVSNVYYEAGADISGPYHVLGFQGDAEGPPKIKRGNHALMASNIAEKNASDFLAAAYHNLLLGGDWDYLTSAGAPVCVASTGGTTVVVDSTEPFGMGRKYGGVFNVAFQNFSITIPPCRSGRFSLALAYQSVDDFAAVEVQRGGGGGTTSGGASVVVLDATNNWKLMRISGNASTTANTAVVLFALVGAGSKTMYIGGMSATQEKAAMLPSAPRVLVQDGSVTQGYVAASPTDVVVTYPRAFASAPILQITISTNGAQTANMVNYFIQAQSATGFTVRVTYAPDWTGVINWSARGIA